MLIYIAINGFVMKFSRIKSFLFLVFAVVSLSVSGQVEAHFPIRLQWNGVVESSNPYDTLLYLALDSGVLEEGKPVYVASFPIYDDAVSVEVALREVKSEPLSDDESKIVSQSVSNANYEIEAAACRGRDQAFLAVRIVPLRKQGGRCEKLVSAVVSAMLYPKHGRSASMPSFAEQSAMTSGKWYKIGLSETGVYKLTYNDLSALGVDLSNLDPRTIRVYHNGGGVLPELNAEARYDDLVEEPIFVSGESDGRFDANDYILFYGRGPVCWRYNPSFHVFEHQQNPYDDEAYAFIVTGLGTGKRIAEGATPSGAAQASVAEFIDYQVHESDDYSLHRVGRAYYGDRMEGNETKSFDFSFPNTLTTREMTLKAMLAGTNYKPASFEVFIDESRKATYNVEAISPTGYSGAVSVGGWMTASPKSSTVNVKVKHNNLTNPTSQGYVDYLSLNVWRSLVFVGPQMLFRNPEADDADKVYEYKLSSASQQVQVWNVGNPVAPTIVSGQLNGTVFSFKVNGAIGDEFVAFDGSGFCTARTIGEVGNQNLHGVRDVDYLIVTYTGFLEHATRLKELHNRINPDLNVFVTTPEMIYNEFSCGAKDITAIRDFCRMLYLGSSAGRELKYLLLLGDCSYDYKNRNGVVDFVPAYETEKSLDMHDSFVTDDYFGFLDENEGNIGSSLLDIGIGRFPVSTNEQASRMVDKIERYVANDATTMQPWRNVVTFFNDDEKEFFNHSEQMARELKDYGGEGVVVDKIYLGAYQQQSSPGGEICPEMNAAINSRMEKGTLVLNYTGHGGEVQLADEKILQRKDVDSWRNAPMYPLMITGTCEFSRYDDHIRTSLGEYAFLNPYGGMIAMFTTSRVTHGPDNIIFNKGVYKNLFRINGGEHYRLGDVYRMAKTRRNIMERRYVFFGDPALRLAYPKWKVETVAINGQFPGYDLDSVPITDSTWTITQVYHDTISALQPVEIEGVVKDLDGNVASGFNGVVNVTVYDKEADLTDVCVTNNGQVSYHPFKLRNSVVFNGKTAVADGRFTISFIVPRDIAYSFGTGMISYYATDYTTDANGKCEDFVIGGFYDEAESDDEAPDLRLFIDDTLFVSGGLTGENPILIAFVEDESGINTTGAGIGHDIMATLSGPSKNSYCLNDYFQAETDNPGKGQITYKMMGLADGDYTLTLKVWDVYNNSATATIDFTVANSSGMSIENPAATPNPFAEETSFMFEHNQVGNNIKVQIQVFDIMGRWVNTLTETIEGTSARTTPIRWNGRNANGERLSNGIYVYRIIATNDQGEMTSATAKLIICR